MPISDLVLEEHKIFPMTKVAHTQVTALQRGQGRLVSEEASQSLSPSTHQLEETNALAE